VCLCLCLCLGLGLISRLSALRFLEQANKMIEQEESQATMARSLLQIYTMLEEQKEVVGGEETTDHHHHQSEQSSSTSSSSSLLPPSSSLLLLPSLSLSLCYSLTGRGGKH